MVMVTHHVDEIPPGFDHALVLREGEVLAAGPLDEALRADVLSAAFGLELRGRAAAERPLQRLGPLTRASSRSRLRSTSSPRRRSSTGPHRAPP